MSRKKPSTPEIRCAIYSRKSSDDGLDQEFNSLDAQREAGEAFIASQKNEGWIWLIGILISGRRTPQLMLMLMLIGILIAISAAICQGLPGCYAERNKRYSAFPKVRKLHQRRLAGCPETRLQRDHF